MMKAFRPKVIMPLEHGLLAETFGSEALLSALEQPGLITRGRFASLPHLSAACQTAARPHAFI